MEKESLLCCPVCGLPLCRVERALVCEKRHSFDLAREGYVNLLCSQQSSQKTHGDDKLMVRSRRDFLERGAYELLRRAVGEELLRLQPQAWLDAGCGEGYYTAFWHSLLPQSRAVGADISKEAVRLAAKRNSAVEWAVASCNALPVANGSLDALTNVFAPTAVEEFARVLRPGGILLRVRPLPEHLWNLKTEIYGPKAAPNPPEVPQLPGFRLLEQRPCKGYTPGLSGEELYTLFCMTPYYYTSSLPERERAASLLPMAVELAFDIQILQREEREELP